MLLLVKLPTHGSLVKYCWFLQNAFERTYNLVFQIQVFPILVFHALPQDFILSRLHHSSSWELSKGKVDSLEKAAV